MITNFIFDMGNVLMDFNPDYILSNYTSDMNTIQTLKTCIFSNPIWKALDNGDLSFSDAKKKLLLTVDTELQPMMEDVLDTWQNHKIPRLDMLELIKELKEKGFGIYLCSNAADRFYDYKDQFEVFSYFDDLCISADINISKPDHRIYEHVLAKNNLKADTCIFIDDIQANVDAAQEVGMYGYHFNGNTAMFKTYLRNIHILV